MILSKQVPNILSICRIILSALLPLFFGDPPLFVTLYLLIGLSDVLDGFIARRYDSESSLGAKLDSIGDLVFYVMLSLYFVVEQIEVFLIYLTPVLVIFAVRAINIAVGLLKYRKLTMIHTVANKAAGIMVFILPVMLIFRCRVFIPLTLAAALLSSAEESVIILRSPKGKIDLNTKSMLRKQHR